MWTPPAHWPVVEHGLLMVGLDNVMFVLIEGDLSPAGEEAGSPL